MAIGLMAQMCASLMAMKNLSKQLKALKNLSHFSVQSGIPRRTLERIKAQPSHNIAPTTRIAIEGALKVYKEPK